MLQQTQVETVIPYYHRFLAQFPTIAALAEAPLDHVLKAWENMGYYSRARNLHGAVKTVLKDFKGKVPETQEELMALPGVGSYTAAAILSMAFDRPVPAVDANVTRVITRVFAIKEPVDRSPTTRAVWDLAHEILPKEGAGQFNQALMDLGATICTSRRPGCTACPLQTLCEANAHHLQNILPVTKKRNPIPHHHVTAGVIRNQDGQILITQRPNKGLLGGLWKLPGGRQRPGESLKTCLKRKVQEEVGMSVRVGKGGASIKHAYTHFRITLHAFHCTYQGDAPKVLGCRDWYWATARHFQDLAFSKADRKIIQALE
jgi:A/G-specific adenine glycosylase